MILYAIFFLYFFPCLSTIKFDVCFCLSLELIFIILKPFHAIIHFLRVFFLFSDLICLQIFPKALLKNNWFLFKIVILYNKSKIKLNYIFFLLFFHPPLQFLPLFFMSLHVQFLHCAKHASIVEGKINTRSRLVVE